MFVFEQHTLTLSGHLRADHACVPRTGPSRPKFASNIASQGFVVVCPSSFHEWEGPEALPYDVEGTDRGNRYKVRLNQVE